MLVFFFFFFFFLGFCKRGSEGRALLVVGKERRCDEVDFFLLLLQTGTGEKKDIQVKFEAKE
jgi:hypothetical protein